jgi:medium-chain acyl-[acyl-carrier-protein] hydrolase
MSDLVDALLAEIPRHLERPFAFFGHSMGAAVAFELIRALRSQALPLPAALLVSGARAPQFRLNHTPPPEPTEQEFLAELRRLEGVPAELLQSPDALRIMLPVLRADARLYRNYIYAPGEPLDIPIFAYGGDSDPNVRREHLEAWREQTGAQFKLRRFPGGHFFLQSSLESFLQALGADLQGIQAGVTGAL